MKAPVHKGEPLEALGYAERAAALTGGKSPEVLDTLGWVYHLLGRNEEAARQVERAVAAHPEKDEFRLHAAVVYAAIGRLDSAGAELTEAIRLDSKLAETGEARAVRAKLTWKRPGARQRAPGR